MLFKRKENKESAKAKFSLFAKKSKDDVLDVKAPSKTAPKKVAAEHAKDQKTFKETIATGKVSPDILSHPRITEKASASASANVYVFDVAPYANKKQIAEAVRDIYKISPVKVRVAKIATKMSTNRRGGKSVTGGGKKAYVYLKQGDTIELV